MSYRLLFPFAAGATANTGTAAANTGAAVAPAAGIAARRPDSRSGRLAFSHRRRIAHRGRRGRSCFARVCCSRLAHAVCPQCPNLPWCGCGCASRRRFGCGAIWRPLRHDRRDGVVANCHGDDGDAHRVHRTSCSSRTRRPNRSRGAMRSRSGTSPDPANPRNRNNNGGLRARRLARPPCRPDRCRPRSVY